MSVSGPHPKAKDDCATEKTLSMRSGEDLEVRWNLAQEALLQKALALSTQA
jgi:hypothetical protein